MAATCWLLAIALAACRTVELHVESDSTNARPFANPGTGGTYLIGASITLDGTGSFDPDGGVNAYRWRIAQRPMHSTAVIANESAATTAFTPDVAGQYIAELTVIDDAGENDVGVVSLYVIGPMIVVNAGVDQSVSVPTTVQLSGSMTAEPGFTITLAWTIDSKPTGSSATLSCTSCTTPTFVADREGDYTIRLTASTPYNAVSDQLVVTATLPRQFLQYVLVDAEYSTALDRFVIVSDVPARLRLHNPATGTESVVTLPEAPVAISLAPNGLRAAVAHATKVSVVNLQTMQVEATHSVAAIADSIFDVVFGADNRVHCFHKSFQFSPIQTVSLQNGNVTEGTWPWVDGYTRARLHPSGQSAYGSRGDFEHYDVTGAQVETLRTNGPYPQHAVGSELWFTLDGTSIISDTGNVFYASTNDMVDMSYRGTLGVGNYTWAAHSQTLGKIAALRIEYDNFSNPIGYTLQRHNAQSLAMMNSEPLPDTPYNNMTYLSQGRFLAFPASSSAIYVIAKVGPNNGLTHVLYTFPP